MDLCLKGSQINLATRQKPKPKYSSQTSLHTSSLLAHSRPRSATQFQKHTRSSTYQYRPQSADPRVGRKVGSACGHYCSERDYPEERFSKATQKHLQTLSSGNLLKLLLDEPIKRSWLCRIGSSPDNDSELSTARRTSSYSSVNRRTRTESASGSSREGDYWDRNQRFSSAVNANRRAPTSSSTIRMSSASSYTNVSKDKSLGLPSKSTAKDYWLSVSTVNLMQKTAKPDLPGRVSFSKPRIHNENDSSDCDNDKQEQSQSQSQSQYQKYMQQPAERVDGISAPGPVGVPMFHFSSEVEETTTITTTHDCGSGLKKSVHFGAGGDAGEEVLAETYEYPKCPSENCSCSTRSSSTASIHDAMDSRCACDSSVCKYAMEGNRRASTTDLDIDESRERQSQVDKGSATATPLDELPVIREYKNAVGDQVANSVVKNILDEGKSGKVGSTRILNNMEIPAYLGKYTAPAKADNIVEKQNNLSETKNLSSFKASAKRNLLLTSATAANELGKTEKKFGQDGSLSQSSVSSTSESVINNYLKVTSAPPIITKKKENNNNNKKPGSADVTPSTNLKNPKSSIQGSNPRSGSKSLNGSAKMRKAISVGCLRDDTNLSEFQLDKVDSWMTMHEEAMTRKSFGKHASSLDDDLEQFTKETLDVMLQCDEEQVDSASQVSSKSEDNSQEDSTYDEIVSVIKEIEDDKKKDNFAECTSELDLKLNTQLDSAECSQTQAEENETPKSPDKYKDILSYLDNVEDSCDKTLLETRRSIPESNRSEVEFIVEPDITEDVPKLSDLLMIPNHQLARRVVALSLRANELANAVLLSKEHVSKIRNEKQKTLRAEKANSANRSREQKKHYEAIVQRHQGFIEQLLKDKGSLCEKVAALTRRLESQNQAWEHKLETEVARVKETTLAGEKIRRERWVRENTKKIKELTVKGLEMEINKMNHNHQQEITDLKRSHQQQLLDALEEARVKHEQIENSIRESCAQDREAIIEKERTAIRERYERQLDEEHKSFDEQKQKLSDDFAAERERLQNEMKLKEVEYQTKRQEIQREKEEELEQAVLELQEKMSKQEEKYQNRINTIEKQYLADFEIWKREYENSCKIAQVEHENTIRQHYRAERDRQIDAIVTRMDAESLKSSEEFEAKLLRLKEKYEKDLEQTESVEKSLREKYAETRSKLAESDAQVRNCQAELKQLQIELGHSKKMCNDFLADRDQYRDSLRGEIQNEMASLKGERDNEIQRIHKRVQQAIEKKDATIDILQKENGSLRERCLKLEAVIRQQRKDYCVK